MANSMGPIMMVVLLIAAGAAFIKRCEWFQVDCKAPPAPNNIAPTTEDMNKFMNPKNKAGVPIKGEGESVGPGGKIYKDGKVVGDVYSRSKYTRISI